MEIMEGRGDGKRGGYARDMGRGEEGWEEGEE